MIRRGLLILVALVLMAGGLVAQEPAFTDVVEAAPATQPAAAAPRRPASTTALPASLTSLPTGGKIAIVKIQGMIYDFTLESFKRRTEKALADGATIIVVELDTPGGMLDASIKLSTYIKQIPNATTIAWVHDQAYSGGTVIAAACHYIIMSPSSYLGDAAPIAMSGVSLLPTERAKPLSPLLEDFRDSARYNHYDYALFHAMCVLDVRLYLIENPATGERKVVNQIDYELMVNGRELPEANVNLTMPAPVPGSPAEADENLRRVALVTRQVATDADLGKWTSVTRDHSGALLPEPFHDGSTLLTLSQDRAMDVGLSQGIVRNEADLKSLLGAQDVGRYDQAAIEGIAYWLTQSWIRGILLMVVLICAALEMQSPGLGVAGSIGIAALIVLIGAPFLIGMAELWHLLLFLLGFVLLMVEIFVTPGFGVLGISGLVCMFIGLVLAVVPSSSGGMGLPAPEMLDQLQWSIVWMILGGVTGIIALAFLTRHFGRLPLLGRMVLRARSTVPAAQVAGTDSAGNPVLLDAPHQAVSGEDAIGGGKVAVGARGTAITELRPTGRASIDGQLVDVMSVGEWIHVGRHVRVVEVHGNLITVQEEG
ncbi:MAG: NfeD family protein [Phycisphaeraceae bacterium]